MADHGTRRGSELWCSRCAAWLSSEEWYSWHRRAGRENPSPHMNEDKRARALEGK